MWGYTQFSYIFLYIDVSQLSDKIPNTSEQ